MSLVILMKNNNKYPFANEVKEMKDNFKRMIDSMSDTDFLDFLDYINSMANSFDDEEDYDEELWSGDEGWEDEAAKFYGYNPDDIQEDDSLPF
jgi:hypothetical protein